MKVQYLPNCFQLNFVDGINIYEDRKLHDKFYSLLPGGSNDKTCAKFKYVNV